MALTTSQEEAEWDRICLQLFQEEHRFTGGSGGSGGSDGSGAIGAGGSRSGHGADAGDSCDGEARGKRSDIVADTVSISSAGEGASIASGGRGMRRTTPQKVKGNGGIDGGSEVVVGDGDGGGDDFDWADAARVVEEMEKMGMLSSSAEAGERVGVVKGRGGNTPGGAFGSPGDKAREDERRSEMGSAAWTSPIRSVGRGREKVLGNELKSVKAELERVRRRLVFAERELEERQQVEVRSQPGEKDVDSIVEPIQKLAIVHETQKEALGMENDDMSGTESVMPVTQGVAGTQTPITQGVGRTRGVGFSMRRKARRPRVRRVSQRLSNRNESGVSIGAVKQNEEPHHSSHQVNDKMPPDFGDRGDGVEEFKRKRHEHSDENVWNQRETFVDFEARMLDALRAKLFGKERGKGKESDLLQLAAQRDRRDLLDAISLALAKESGWPELLKPLCKLAEHSDYSNITMRAISTLLTHSNACRTKVLTSADFHDFVIDCINTALDVAVTHGNYSTALYAISSLSALTHALATLSEPPLTEKCISKLCPAALQILLDNPTSNTITHAHVAAAAQIIVAYHLNHQSPYNNSMQANIQKSFVMLANLLHPKNPSQFQVLVLRALHYAISTIPQQLPPPSHLLHTTVTVLSRAVHTIYLGSHKLYDALQQKFEGCDISIILGNQDLSIIWDEYEEWKEWEIERERKEVVVTFAMHVVGRLLRMAEGISATAFMDEIVIWRLRDTLVMIRRLGRSNDSKVQVFGKDVGMRLAEIAEEILGKIADIKEHSTVGRRRTVEFSGTET